MFQRQNKEFASPEHRFLGNITLQGLPNDFQRFTFPTQAALTFGEIIALAGDYFGVYLLPIALGASEEDRQKRFLMAYQELKTCPPEKINKIIRDISNDDVQQKILIRDIDNHVIMLAEHNIDHFNDYAVSAFAAGYALAMQAAVLAADEKSDNRREERLAYAYSLLAYACHFLTDRFAAGHIRTPRLELDQLFSPEIGSLLAFFQHNEDGDRGLEVQSATVDNPAPTPWMAYGDGHLFEHRNSECRKRVQAAVQVAADEVYQAYHTKQIIQFKDSMINRLLPTVTANNHPPLFKVDDNGKMLCRVPLSSTTSQRYAVLTRAKAIELLLVQANQSVLSVINEKIDDAIDWLRRRDAVDNGKWIDQSLFALDKPSSQAGATIKVRPTLMK